MIQSRLAFRGLSPAADHGRRNKRRDKLTNSSGREDTGSRAGRGGRQGVGARGIASGRGTQISNETDAGRLQGVNMDLSPGRDGYRRIAGKGRGDTTKEWSTGLHGEKWDAGKGRGDTTKEWSTGRHDEKVDAGAGRGDTTEEWGWGIDGDRWDARRGRRDTTREWCTGSDEEMLDVRSGRGDTTKEWSTGRDGKKWDAERRRGATTRECSRGTYGDRWNAGRGRGTPTRDWSKVRGRERWDTGRGRGATTREWSRSRDGERWDAGKGQEKGREVGKDHGTTANDWSTGTNRFRSEWNSERIRGEDHKWDTRRGLGRKCDISDGRGQIGNQEGVSLQHPGHPELGTDRKKQDENEMESTRDRGGSLICSRSFGARVAKEAMHWSRGTHENVNVGGRAPEERGRGHRGNWNHRGYQGCIQSSATRGRRPIPRWAGGNYRQQLSTSSKLFEWQTDEADVIVCKLNCNNQADLNQLLADDDISPENMCLFVKVLSIAITSDSSRQGVLDILITVFTEKFIAKLLRFQLSAYTNAELDLKEFFRCQHELLSSYFNAMPLNALDKIPELLQTVQLLLQNHVRDYPELEWAEILQLYERLLEHFNKYLAIKKNTFDKRKNLQHKLSILDSVNPADDFREIPTEPTFNDITSPCRPFVRRNIVDGKYTDVHTYLDVQFRLLREDFIRPLREGVQQYIGNTSGRNNNVRIYRDVQVINSDIIRGKLIYFVELNFPKKIKLENSKRLMFENLVCVSDDNFASFFLALVGDRDKMVGERIVGISPLSKVKINFSSSYTVAEPTAFFVAYKHVLAALQRMDQDKFPFADNIVFVDTKVEPPRYLQNDPESVYDLSAALQNSASHTNRGNPIVDPSAVPVTAGIDEWPPCESFGFDQSQLIAFHAALTSRLALIQGPPGTGKTFLGLKIVQTLLHNSELWSDGGPHPPILVVCLTNHALDQFLEGMLKFTKKIVRFGSMSKNAIIQGFNVKWLLNELKWTRSVPRCLFDAKTSAQHNYSSVEHSYKNYQTVLRRVVKNEGLLRFSFLERNKIIPPQISQQLTDVSYREWILSSNERAFQLPALTPVGKIWENKTEGTQSSNESVPNEDERLDVLDLEYEEEKNRIDDDDLKFFSNKSTKTKASTDDFEILTSNLDNELRQLNKRKKMNERNPTIYFSLEDQDRFHFLRYQLRCLRRLAYFTKTDVTHLELIRKTNVHKLCFQDRCLLYSSWRNKLINCYHKQIAALEDQLHKYVEGGGTDDPSDELLNTASMVDLNDKIRALQCRLAGVTEHEGVLEWDTLVCNGVIPLDISEQLCNETYNTWILPLDPRVQVAAIHPHIWKLWRNTPNSIDKVWNESDLRKWKAKMENVRMEIPVTLCPEFLSVSSEDQEFEVLYENYDYKLEQLRYLANNKIIFWRNYEMMSNKIRNERDCLRRVLSFTKKDVTSPETNDDVNVHNLAFADRCLLYATWKQELIKRFREKCRPYELMVQQLNSKIEEITRSQYLHLARQAEVVGMTTTGAAEYQGLVQDLQPKIVIVEEAAQILEAHVVTALSASCEHLIMIGDHQQLRPNPAVYELAIKYGLETSMFERMIKNGLPYQTLELQHRMRPEISCLLVPAIYPFLKDHESVSLRPAVPGMSSSVFFFSHDHKEDKETDDNSSHSNPMEAEFTMQLARHLVLQGYSTEQITVLTPYSGQFLLLKQELEKQPECEGMLVTKLDNYQGEENDIVLLSLVRNNDQGNVGFLKIENRVCVALSRAKQGLYIIGNIDQMCRSTPLWVKIKESLTETNSVGKTLTLHCQNHPDEVSLIKTTQDFLLMSPEGGCTKSCTASFPKCNHPCPRKCHVIDPEHTDSHCMLPCEKKCTVGNHDCEGLCWENCPNCLISVTIELPCGHSPKIECYRSTEKVIYCPTLIVKEIPDCKHVTQMECSYDPLEVECAASCSARLDCGHTCRNICHVRNDPNHYEYSCQAPCALNNKNCSQEHKCALKCDEECLLCPEMAEKKAGCGHFFKVKCSFDMKDLICKTNCKRMLNCRHRCPRKCFEECGGCKVMVEKTLPSCDHGGKFPCGDDLKDAKCHKACSRLLECGHRCPRKCSERCGGCKVMMNKSFPDCGHAGRFPCSYDLRGEKCLKQCGRLLECEHKCPRKCCDTCGGCQVKVKKMLCKCGHTAIVACSSDTDSWQCKIPCKRVLECGHNCTLRCYEECALAKCSARVTKTAGCGHTALVVCSDDMERYKCKMSCKRLLQCGHKCPRKCCQDCGGCQGILPRTPTSNNNALVTLHDSNKSEKNLSCCAVTRSAIACIERGARQSRGGKHRHALAMPRKTKRKNIT